jgi:exonuclease SbcC
MTQLSNNDLMHSTAFFEVARNLASYEGYQVIMSTHDMQQARFFRNKSGAMAVPYVECQFTGSGEEGIHHLVAFFLETVLPGKKAGSR